MTRPSLIPMATALAGMILLAALTLQPQPGAASHGLLFPPWISRAEAFSRAAALGLPISDIRLGGRLIVLSAAPSAGWLASGAVIINPGPAMLCNAAFPPQEPVV